MAEVKVIEVQIKSNIDGATSSVSKLKSGLNTINSNFDSIFNIAASDISTYII